MFNTIPIGFWRSAPAPLILTALKIWLRVLNLTILNQTGSESWPDSELSDGQANNSLVTWNGGSMPVFNGTGILGTITQFQNVAFASPAITPVGPLHFEAFMTGVPEALTSAVGYYQLFSVTTNLCMFQVRVNTTAGGLIRATVVVIQLANPFTTEVILGPFTITSLVMHQIGFKCILLNVADFTLQLVVNGNVEAGAIIPYALGEVSGAGISLGTGSGPAGVFTSKYDFRAFNLSTL